jgi:hypothetical protein
VLTPMNLVPEVARDHREAAPSDALDLRPGRVPKA